MELEEPRLTSYMFKALTDSEYLYFIVYTSINADLTNSPGLAPGLEVPRLRVERDRLPKYTDPRSC